jgi:hypothetical protein
MNLKHRTNFFEFPFLWLNNLIILDDKKSNIIFKIFILPSLSPGVAAHFTPSPLSYAPVD